MATKTSQTKGYIKGATALLLSEVNTVLFDGGGKETSVVKGRLFGIDEFGQIKGFLKTFDGSLILGVITGAAVTNVFDSGAAIKGYITNQEVVYSSSINGILLDRKIQDSINGYIKVSDFSYDEIINGLIRCQIIGGGVKGYSGTPGSSNQTGIIRGFVQGIADSQKIYGFLKTFSGASLTSKGLIIGGAEKTGQVFGYVVSNPALIAEILGYIVGVPVSVSTVYGIMRGTPS